MMHRTTQARHIIGKFGRVAALQEALGHRWPTTVYHWRDRGVIPVRQQGRVLAAARRLGVPLEPEDFFVGLPTD